MTVAKKPDAKTVAKANKTAINKATISPKKTKTAGKDPILKNTQETQCNWKVFRCSDSQRETTFASLLKCSDLCFSYLYSKLKYSSKRAFITSQTFLKKSIQNIVR